MQERTLPPDTLEGELVALDTEGRIVDWEMEWSLSAMKSKELVRPVRKKSADW
jgi:hypothetical protein